MTIFDRLGIGGKLALAFGALASITVLVVLLSFLANREVTREIRVAEGDRLPASLATARAQASLLRMQMDVRGYLVLGEPADLEQFDTHRREFEGSLQALLAMAKGWGDNDAHQVAQLARDYEQWIRWPRRLFELHDNPLKNRPALRLARLELQPRRVDVLKQIGAIAELMHGREPTSRTRQDLEQLAAFQNSFDAMATNLMAYAASGELNFKLAYGPQLATNAAQWQVLASGRTRMDPAWYPHLDAIAARRAEIGEIALQIVNVIGGERAYEDLYLYRTEAEPQAQRLLAVLERLTRTQQSTLQRGLSEARDSLGAARVPATVGGLLAIALALTLALLCQHYIVGPVRRLTKVAEQVAAADAHGEEAESRDELGRLAQMIQTRLKKEELQLLMASVSDAIWSAEISCRDGLRYRYWSPAIERITGLPPDHFFQSTQSWLDLVDPDDHALVQQALERITSGASDREEAEYRIVCADGMTRWVRDSVRATRLEEGRALLNGVIGDITARKGAESALRESEARFRALTQLSSDWYWKQDARLRFVYLSDESAEKTGWTNESSLGKRRDELTGATLLTGSWAEHQSVLDARLPFRDLEYSRTDSHGQARFISVSGAPIFDERNEFLGYQGVGRDVTARRCADEELRRLEYQLRQAQRLETVGTLAGGIAHDFNNILGAILGYGEMALRDAAPDTRLRRDLDSIMLAGERGRVLVDRILMFSRSSVGEQILVPVQDVIREAFDLVIGRIPLNVRVETRFEAGRAAMLGDPTQVHQVVSNLASNALQAMPQGGLLQIALQLHSQQAARGHGRHARAGQLHRPHGLGHRTRHLRRHPGAHLRPLFHHEGSRSRNGPRPFARARHRDQRRGRRGCAERSRNGQQVHGVLPAPRQRSAGPRAGAGCKTGLWERRGSPHSR
jgi:PAS domain S-box-containing protein